MTKKIIQPEASLPAQKSGVKKAYTLSQAYLSYRKQRIDQKEKDGFEFDDSPSPKPDRYELTTGMVKEAAPKVAPKTIHGPGEGIVIIARANPKPDREEAADKSGIN